MERRIVPEVARRFDIAWTVSGLREQERSFLSDAALGFALCVAGIYLTLAWIFGSWSRPLVVVLVIPFGLVGAVWGHVWMGAPLSMFSVVGLIGMAGIIVNDAIVLITTMAAYARERALIPSLIDATCDRLRPVFLTTATTLAGFGPMLWERSTQAQFLKPTVITLFFGLGAGMLLVLVVVPTMVAVAHDISRSLVAARRLVRARLARRRGLGRGAGPRPLPVTSSAR
jgi:multidrug efflux pump subunit AcrB